MMTLRNNIQYIRLWYFFTFLCYTIFLFIYSVILEQTDFHVFEFLFSTLLWPVYMFYLTLIDVFFNQGFTIPNILVIGLPISTLTFIGWFKTYSEKKNLIKSDS